MTTTGPARPPGDPDDELLSAYLDGEVTAGERSEIDDALARSVKCRAALAELAEARDAVRGLDEPDLPAGFLVAVEQAVAEGAPVRRAAPGDARTDRGRPRRGLAWFAGGAAAAAVLAAFVVPAADQVDPAVRARVDAHAARASVSEDPVSRLAPVATATGGLRR